MNLKGYRLAKGVQKKGKTPGKWKQGPERALRGMGDDVHTS